MPRNSSGTYTLPATYNPVVSGTAILAAWANTTLPDIGQGLTDSLDRSGRGGMLAPFKATDGAVSTPGITFNNETTTGIYRPGAGLIGFSVLGAEAARISATAFSLAGAVVFSAPGGAVGAPSYTFTGDSNTGMWSPAADILSWSVGGVEGMRLDSAGNLGVGITPSARIHTAGNSEGLRISHDSAFIGFYNSLNTVRSGYVQISTGGMELANELATQINFRTNGILRLIIGADGTLTHSGTTGVGQQILVSHPDTDGGFVTFNRSGSTIYGYIGNSARLVTSGSSSNFGIRAESALNLAIGSTSRVLVDSSGAIVNSTSRAAIGSGIDPLAVNGSFGFIAQLNGLPGTNTPIELVNRSTGGGIDFYPANSLWFRMFADGRIAGRALHNNAGSVSGTTEQYIASGTYTPTFTNVSNWTSITAAAAQWVRVGNVVTVSGTFSGTTTTGANETRCRATLPIASALTNQTQLAGAIGVNSNNIYLPGTLLGDTVNDQAQFDFDAAPTSAVTAVVTYTYSYVIL